MKAHDIHANFRISPSQKLNRPNGFFEKDKHFLVFFHFHSHTALTLNGCEILTSPHACVFVDSHTPHALKVDKTILHDWIIFDGEQDFAPLLEKIGLRTDTVYYPEDYANISVLTERMERNFFEGDAHFPIYFEARMRDILLILAHQKNLTPPPGTPPNQPNDMYLLSLHRLLYTEPNLLNYSEERILSTAKCSRSTLFRHYIRLFGCTPYEDLQTACLKRGERYLRESTFTVEQIAELLGYKSANVFIRRFKRKNGLTPNEWRKQAITEKIKNTKLKNQY